MLKTCVLILLCILYFQPSKNKFLGAYVGNEYSNKILLTVHKHTKDSISGNIYVPNLNKYKSFNILKQKGEAIFSENDIKYTFHSIEKNKIILQSNTNDIIFHKIYSQVIDMRDFVALEKKYDSNLLGGWKNIKMDKNGAQMIIIYGKNGKLDTKITTNNPKANDFLENNKIMYEWEIKDSIIYHIDKNYTAQQEAQKRGYEYSSTLTIGKYRVKQDTLFIYSKNGSISLFVRKKP